MPDYKKKHIKKHIISNKKPKVAKKAELNIDDIEMKPKTSKKTKPQKRQNMNVIKGNKLQRMRKFQTTLASVVAVTLIFTILSLLLPVGIFENVNNLLAMLGKGGYPIELYGSQTLNAVSGGNYYYVLTDTNLGIRSNNGKDILSISHGFTKPVLKTTATRALAFDQGGTDLFIANLREKVIEREFEDTILNAAISRCGVYAVAHNADNYSSVVSVYSKNDKLLYEWYSADETVNNIAVSPNGKKIAVSTVSASGGKLISKLYVFGYESANPLYTLDLGDSAVYNIDTSLRSGFSVVTSGGFKFISWSKYKISEYTTELQITSFKANSNGMVAVSTLVGNKSDNKIAVFNSRGKKISEFSFHGIISDIQISRNHIYCMGESVVSIYSKNGELLRTAECDFSAVRIAVLSSYSVAVIKNDEISRLEIKK